MRLRCAYCAIGPDEHTGTSKLVGIVDREMANVLRLRRDLLGRIDQWDEVYPDRRTVLADVQGKTAHLAVDADGVVDMVVLNEEQEPEYADVPWAGSASGLAR